MGHGPNVLWKLHTQSESDAGYHRGADVSMLSQFEKEKEILFPPATMLVVQQQELARKQARTVLKMSRDGQHCSVDQRMSASDVRYIEVDVVPTFV
jgi:hypothetical protein